MSQIPSPPSAGSPGAGSQADAYRLLVESVADYAIYLVALEERIASWNPAAQRIYGYRTDEIVGQSFKIVYTPEDAANGRATANFQTALEVGHIEFESLRMRKDGSCFWAMVAVSVVRDDAGRHAGFSVVTRDITERTKAAEAVRRERDVSRAILESLPGVFYMYDESLRFLRWNRRFEEVTEYRADEIARLSPLDFFDGSAKAAVEERIAEVFRDGFGEVEAEFVSKSGRRLPYYFNGVRAVIDGRAYLLGMGIDISKRKRAEESLRDSEAKLDEAVRLARLGYWSRDFATGVINWSPLMFEIFGVDPERFGHDFNAFADTILPEDRDAAVARIAAAEAAATSFDHVFRVRVGGDVRQIHEVGRVLAGEDGKPGRIVGTTRDVTELTRVEEALRLRDRAIQAVSQGILITDAGQPDNPIIFANDGFHRMTGYASDEVLGKNCRFLQGKDTDRETVAQLRAAVAEGRGISVEILNYRKDGTPYWNQLTISPVLSSTGQVTHFVGVQVDVSERRRLEQQYLQSQKMDAIGQLAGGVAHDFNNLLTVINGYSDLLMGRLRPGDSMRELLGEILKAGERAGTLTRQLLAFSRQQVLQPKVLNLNAVVGETEKMLGRLIGADIVLRTDLCPTLGNVKTDAGQIGQVLMNLAVNARDAMPKGGMLTIETHNVQLEESYCRAFADLEPGPYVLLAVTDSGCGMDEATRSRIFEPFFTTKGVGKGSGLGLATVHGIVKQSRGHIAVYSEVGYGTTFKVYLPRVFDAVAPVAAETSEAMPRGTETILLVEDEDAVRALASHVLRQCGFRVIEARDGAEAIRLCEGESRPIHLLISDVVMPHLGGRALADRVIALRPNCRLLFLSGYADDAVIRHGILEAEYAFLQKPFTPSALAKKVRTVLDA